MDTRKLLDQLVGSGFAGGLAGGALAGLITGNKKTRKLAGSAAKLGGLALVAGIAYKAWQQHQQGRPAAAPLSAPPPDSGFLPPESDPAGAQSLSLLLVRAMIAAAKADGKIDTAESQKILSHINTLDLPEDDKAFLFEEYTRPLDIEALARDVPTREQATEVFAASVLMLDPPSAPERIYLEGLAGALSLEPSLARQIQSAAAEAGTADA